MSRGYTDCHVAADVGHVTYDAGHVTDDAGHLTDDVYHDDAGHVMSVMSWRRMS